MGKRFETYKQGHRIRQSIKNSTDQIAQLEQFIAESKQCLADAPSNADAWAVGALRVEIKHLESDLLDLKRNHNRYVTEQRRPSPAFRRGITV